MVNTPTLPARVVDPRGTNDCQASEVGPLLAAPARQYVYYEVDGDTSKHHLDVSNYGQENEWVLLSCLLSDRAVHWSV